QFLRHVERTRLIVHIIDMSGFEGREPFKDFQKINEELEHYDKRLMEKKQIIVANKMDMPNAEKNLQTFKQQLEKGIKVYSISALTKEGLRELLYSIADALAAIPKAVEMEEQIVIQPQTMEEPF